MITHAVGNEVWREDRVGDKQINEARDVDMSELLVDVQLLSNDAIFLGRGEALGSNRLSKQ